MRNTQTTLHKKQKDYGPWINYFLRTLSKQINFLKDQISITLPISILNKNEKYIYQIIKTRKICNIATLLEESELSRGGLKSLLNRLVTRGFIIKEGRGKSTIYRSKK